MWSAPHPLSAESFVSSGGAQREKVGALVEVGIGVKDAAGEGLGEVQEMRSNKRKICFMGTLSIA
jgi:hypothetical protein